MTPALALEAVTTTELAAIASANWTGLGQSKAADKAAVDAMRQALGQVPFSGQVVIGEGERDEAPMLYIGEKLGLGGPVVDIAVDPLEGTNLCAYGHPNAWTVIAMANQGDILHAPDVYMDKIAVGPGLPTGIIDLDASTEVNLHAVAKAKNIPVTNLVVCLMNRERNSGLEKSVREVGARVFTIEDGDVSAIIATAMEQSPIDLYIGIGAAPEGALAAAALRCLGGQMQGRLWFKDEAQEKRALEPQFGISDLNRKYDMSELAGGDDMIFAATGVTDGWLLEGVRDGGGGRCSTQTLLLHKASRTQRIITTYHNAPIS